MCVPRSCEKAAAFVLATALGTVLCVKEARAEDLVLALALDMELRAPERTPESNAQGPGAEGGLDLVLRLERSIDSGGETWIDSCGTSCLGLPDPGSDTMRDSVAVIRNRRLGALRGVSAAVEGETTSAPTSSAKSDAAAASPPWRLPPIRWHGSLGNSFTWNGAPGQSSLGMTQTSDINASTFIWQPWFLLVGGNLSLTQSSSVNSGASGGSSGAETSNRTKGLGFGGGVTLDLFPQSRFPISAAFNAQESRTTSIQSTTTGGYAASLRGQYSPAEGGDRYSGGYYRNASSVEGVNVGTSDQISAEYSTNLPKFLNGTHSLALTGNWNRSVLADHTNDNTFYRLFGKIDSDLYDDYGFRIYSNGDYYTNENLTVGGRQTVSALLLSSSGSWVPEDDLPLSVNGAGSFSSVQSSGAGTGRNAQTATISASASYRYNSFITLGAGAAFQSSQFGSALSGNGNINASYSGDPRDLGDYKYNWSVNGGANGVVTSAAGAAGSFSGSSGVSLSSGAHHQLTRVIQLGPLERLNLTLSQGLSMSTSQTLGFTGSLSTSASAAYALVPREAMNLTSSVSASDSHAFGTYGSNFQSLSVGVNGSAQLSRYSSLLANISASLTRSGASKTTGTDLPEGSSSWTAGGSGTIGYQHGRAFGYNRLRYNANYTLTPSGWGSSTLQPVGALSALSSPGNRWSHAFNQGVSYSLGRIRMSLTNSFTFIGQQHNASIMLTVVREIGNY